MKCPEPLCPVVCYSREEGVDHFNGQHLQFQGFHCGLCSEVFTTKKVLRDLAGHDSSKPGGSKLRLRKDSWRAETSQRVRDRTLSLNNSSSPSVPSATSPEFSTGVASAHHLLALSTTPPLQQGPHLFSTTLQGSFSTQNGSSSSQLPEDDSGASPSHKRLKTDTAPWEAPTVRHASLLT